MRVSVKARRASLLLLLLLCAAQFSQAQRPAGFYLSVSLTRGERSRDSHSSTTVITVEGGKLVYDKTYRGYRRGGGEPVHKEFQLAPGEEDKIRLVADTNGLLKSNTLAFTSDQKGLYTYFDLTIKSRDRGRESVTKISGPRRSEKIKQEALYKRADGLLQQLFDLAHTHDDSITYEGLD